MMGELLERYRNSTFQAALKQAYAACARQRLPLQAALGPLVLQVQKPILEKYGLPGSPQGVELMKHGVQRRICEGSRRLQDLANAAREALGIEQLPSREVSAEEQLAKSADDTAARFGATKTQLRDQCLELLDQATAKGTLPKASARFLHELLDDEAPVPSVLCLFRMAQLGVEARLLRGSGVPKEVPVLQEAPSCEELRSYVLSGTPVVVRGAFVADKGFGPAKALPDFDFLRKKCSHRRVLVKSLGFQDASGRAQFMTDPELKLPFAAYLDAVEACEEGGRAMPYYMGKVPLRAELPELAEEVEGASTSPQKEYGSCFGELLPEGVFTYFGCGRNSTSVHYDCHENLMVCLCGQKRLWLYAPGDARYVYPISKDRGSSTDFSRSSILPFRRFGDLSPGDQARYPLLGAAAPLEIQVGPGDLLYLPACWWHCVEGSDDRNIILNWWFALHPDKKRRAFQEDSTPGRRRIDDAAAAAAAPGFYICGVDALHDDKYLHQLGIKCILNAAQDRLYSLQPHHGRQEGIELAKLPELFEVKIVGADDCEDCNLSMHFQDIADFIEAGRAKGGVVVHCAAGVSRASTSCMAYLMMKEHWKLEAAHRKIHAVRNIVCPNSGFWRQLRDLEASLEAQGIVLRPLPEDWMPPPQPTRKGEEERSLVPRRTRRERPCGAWTGM
ncbi:unnamed protein product [Effrenium voratum]|nr:unnamed protein product [Effrenium voratum]